MENAPVAKLTVKAFFARFPNDGACLAHIMEVRYGLRHDCGACGVEATIHKLTGRRAYSCAACGHHVYPCAGTILQDSRTSLVSWFYAIYLFVTTRHGVSAKELERQLGVTYKTAWRMGQQIRQLAAKADIAEMLTGHVEADEAYVGGKRSGDKRGRGAPGKTIVVGLAERGGAVRAMVAGDVKKATLRAIVNANVEKGATVSTNELASYNLLTGDGYTHDAVKHGEREYSYYDRHAGVTHHVNSVESFWRLFKQSIASTHIYVSAKYMDRYFSEFTFRANHRQRGNAMFDLLVGAL